MEVKAVESTRKGHPGSHIQCSEVSWCCDKMGAAWIQGNVVFGNPFLETINQNPNVGLVPDCLNKMGYSASAVEYCPYCGEKIYVEVKGAGDNGNTTGRG